jgi:hypothetical protein
MVKLVKELNRDIPVIILGDFNQVNHSAVYDLFITDGYKDPFDNCIEMTAQLEIIAKYHFTIIMGK